MEDPMLAAWLEGKEKEELGPSGVKTPFNALQGLIRSTMYLRTWDAIWSESKTLMKRLRTSQRPLLLPQMSQ
jgi:hypothetical protein